MPQKLRKGPPAAHAPSRVSRRKRAIQQAERSAPRASRWLATGGAGIILIAAAVAGLRSSGPKLVIISDRSGFETPVLEMIDREIALARESPNNAETHGRLGALYEANAICSAAIESYAHAESLAPEDPIWPYHRAICLKATGDVAGATALLRRVVAASPNFAPAQQRLAEWMLVSGDLENAEVGFRTVIHCLPEKAMGYAGMADVMVRKKKYREAVAAAEKALSLDSSLLCAHYTLGLAYRGLGDLDRAKRELAVGSEAKRPFLSDRLFSLMQKFEIGVKPILAQARKLETSGRAGEAAALLESAIARQPDEFALVNNLATIYLNCQKFDRASQLLRRAVEIEPSNFSVYINLCVCGIRTNQLNEALVAADRAVALGPNVGAAHVARSDVLTLLSRIEEALAELGIAARLDARNADVFQKQGDLLLQLARPEDARQMYEISSRLAPQSFAAHINRGATALMVGHVEEARAALASAKRIEPDNPSVKVLLARIEQADAGR